MKSEVGVSECDNLKKIRADGQDLAVSMGRNTLFGVINNVAQVGTRLVTIPIVISHIGLDGYGIWSIIMTAGVYMRFGTIGIKAAFQKYVADATVTHDYETVSKLLSTGCALLFLLSILGLTPVCLYSHGIARLTGVPPQFVKSAGGAISMLALIMVIANVGAVYEAIVMGGHRIDIVRKAGTIFCVLEAICVVAILRLGYGLFAMAAIMGASELCYIVWCYLASSKIVPEIHVSSRYITRTVFRELARYAGSYQLVSVLQMVYGALLPIAILRAFGANAAGVYALAQKLVNPVEMMRSALFVPMLSGGAMVYASGEVERMQALLMKSFKATLLLSVPILVFVSTFGAVIIRAWTGTTNALLPVVLRWVSVSTLFGTFSVFGLVLYRVSGQAVMDNLREVSRIIVILFVLLFVHQLGIYGVLAGAAVAELCGASIMFIALTKTFKAFRFGALLPEMRRVVSATVLVVAVGWIGSHFPVPASLAERTAAAAKLFAICLACVAAVWPVAAVTGVVSRSEVESFVNIFRRRA